MDEWSGLSVERVWMWSRYMSMGGYMIMGGYMSSEYIYESGGFE